tara:strand:+ start:540 stop:947 length:408 start_codon:yes stop_codon:yes gene_type:complete
MEINMTKEITTSYENMLKGFSTFQRKQQVRNLCYNAHRAMYQTKESDRFSGIKESYDIQWERMSEAQEQKLNEKDSEAWNRTIAFTEALDQDFKHMLIHINVLNTLYKLAFGISFEYGAKKERPVAKVLTITKAA